MVRGGAEGKTLTLTVSIAGRDERASEARFEGKVTDSRLVGELTTPRGRAKVTGTPAQHGATKGGPGDPK